MGQVVTFKVKKKKGLKNVFLKLFSFDLIPSANVSERLGRKNSQTLREPAAQEWKWLLCRNKMPEVQIEPQKCSTVRRRLGAQIYIQNLY